MNKLAQKIEFISNVLIIVVTVFLVITLVQNYFSAFSASSRLQQPTSQLQLNDNLSVQVSDVNFSEKPKSLILVLQAGCLFCTESAPFYKRIIKSAKEKNIKLVAVLPTDVEESSVYLNKLGIDGLEVKQATLASLQVRGTPTLILTNNKGEITNFWEGKLKTEKENEVIESLENKVN